MAKACEQDTSMRQLALSSSHVATCLLVANTSNATFVALSALTKFRSY